jgi:hypothetical protein
MARRRSCGEYLARAANKPVDSNSDEPGACVVIAVPDRRVDVDELGRSVTAARAASRGFQDANHRTARATRWGIISDGPADVLESPTQVVRQLHDSGFNGSLCPEGSTACSLRWLRPAREDGETTVRAGRGTVMGGTVVSSQGPPQKAGAAGSRLDPFIFSAQGAFHQEHYAVRYRNCRQGSRRKWRERVSCRPQKKFEPFRLPSSARGATR